MEQDRLCISCGADLVGPFQPRLNLTHSPAAEGSEEVKVVASCWICPGCALVHWFAADSDLDTLMALLPAGAMAAQPGSSYERRSQMLRMMRRVRRM